MPIVNKSALVSYTVEQMYQLVIDVSAYPEFVPWVTNTTVHRHEDDMIEASIEMSKGPVCKSFTTRNRLTPNSGMTLSLVDGPFQHLEGKWSFLPLGEHGCKVILDMDFEFSSRLLSMTVGPVFNEMVNKLMDAFINRAPKIYG